MRSDIVVPPSSHAPLSAPTRTVWPDAVAYREAVQTPSVSLGEPGWKTASIAVNRLGLPVTYAGRFAVVFRATLATGEKWALRGFTSPGADAAHLPGHVSRAMRYQLLIPHAAQLPHLFVPFRYVENGIKVGTAWYPVVAMQWANGTPLGQWIEKNLANSDKLKRLCGVLSAVLGALEAADMAHGDWQHDNLLVSDSGDAVTLVDYDGLYVPELAGTPSPESGHPNYQHPARTSAHFGPGMDRFACLVLQTGLLALAHKPSLWARFSDGESVLFQKNDFADPSRSPVFHAVRAVAQEFGDETLADTIARLEDACRTEAGETLLPAVAPAELLFLPAAETLAAPLQTGQENGEKSAAAVWWEQAQNASAKNTAQTGKSAATLWWEQASKTGSKPLSTAQWWQAANASAASTFVANGTSSANPTFANTGETYAFLERLALPETLAAEAKSLKQGRVGLALAALMLLLVLFMVTDAVGGHRFHPNGGLFLFFLFFRQFGKSKWPRQIIYEELTAEIAKMENLAKTRLDKVLVVYGGSKTAPPSGATVGEYVADKLRQTNARMIVSNNRFQASTLRLLREAGIETVLDLQRRTHIPKVPPHTLHALQQWVHELESVYADEYRKIGGASGTSTPPRQTPQEASRLRDEAREFQREAAKLKRERDLFPDVSHGAYLRKLLGLPEGAGKP